MDVGNRAHIVYLTVCTQGRKAILAHADVHKLLREAWSAANNWLVGRYVIMPDHIHLFCAPATFPYEPLRGWMRYWKSVASRRWPRPDEHPVWHPDGWDRQLRHGDSYREKWDYVRDNPVRESLVETSDEWPYQGEMNVLMWHDA